MRGVDRLGRTFLPLVLTACTAWLAACGGPEARRTGERFSWEPESVMVWPVAGSIVSPFGASSRPDHRGMDLASRPATLVVAAIPGTVNFVGKIPGYGNVVTIGHESHLTTVYAHLGETEVKEGQRVARGEGIGRIGSDGYLHYEVRRAKEAVDPATFYEVAPRPLPGGSERPTELSAEPVSEVSISGTTISVAPAPPPAQNPAPTAPVAARAPLAAPVESPSVTNAPAASAAVGSVPASKPPPPVVRGALGVETSEDPATTSGVGPGRGAMAVAEGAGVVFSNLLYVPAKLVYASAGAVTGGFVLVMAHDLRVASDVWSQTMGGDYLVLPGHLRGEMTLRFRGGSSPTEPSTATPPAAPPPPARVTAPARDG